MANNRIQELQQQIRERNEELHERYPGFIEYDDAEDYQNKMVKLRNNIIVTDKK